MALCHLDPLLIMIILSSPQRNNNSCNNLVFCFLSLTFPTLRWFPSATALCVELKKIDYRRPREEEENVVLCEWIIFFFSRVLINGLFGFSNQSGDWVSKEGWRRNTPCGSRALLYVPFCICLFILIICNFYLYLFISMLFLTNRGPIRVRYISCSAPASTQTLPFYFIFFSWKGIEMPEIPKLVRICFHRSSW